MPASVFNDIDGINNLLIKIGDGDVHSFEIIFRYYSTPLSNYAYRMLQDDKLTEDIVQEVFISIWQNRHKLKNISNFKNYLFILSKHRIINELKKKAKEYVKKCSLDEIVDTFAEDEVNGLQEKVEREHIYDLIDLEIDKLPAQQQRILKLAKLERKSYQQIAELLNISIETVRKHMFLANKTLRNNIQGKTPEILIIIFFSKYF